ncbi:MAG: NFACT family protein [Peptococcaceae bacterium]|jgi:predicted ribosome quality control (RQC) complex YloA/Tae2 family protein|nr:NFACT family protein [Peptococcaceae bacterium]
MAFEGIVMRGVAHELNERLEGARVDKIYQPNRHEVVLGVRARGQSEKLLFSVLAQEARVHLTTSKTPNPVTPPLFCMVLRKHLEGGRILSVAQEGFDRILTVTVQAANEVGDTVRRQLVAEIMGKHSNLILTDPESGKIIDAIHRVPPDVSRYRQILPGFLYQSPPPQEKTALWDETEEGLARRLMGQDFSKPLDRILLSLYGGIGPQTAQEILFRAGFAPTDLLEFCGQYEIQRLWQVIEGLAGDLRAHRYTPETLAGLGRFSAVRLTQFPEDERRAHATVNEALDCFYQNRGVLNLTRQRRNDLDQILRREKERCEKKAGLQWETVREADNVHHLRLYGELLTANLHQIPQGPEASVQNFYEQDNALTVIPMDPRKTPSENAQAYFKMYRKARHGAEIAQVHYDETLLELAYLDSVQTAVHQSETLDGLAEIREELQESGYIKKEPAQRKKAAKQPDRAGADYISKAACLGFEIYCGKNNRQNDYLTMKMARGEDIWLHTKDIPGSHVLIKNPGGRDVPPEVVEKAAQWAAWHSKARQSSKAPVDYTKRKHVWKPNGARPGMALYKNQQTLYVSPGEPET